MGNVKVIIKEYFNYLSDMNLEHTKENKKKFIDYYLKTNIIMFGDIENYENLEKYLKKVLRGV